MEGETSSDSQLHKHLEICGFGGQWFDCRDVEGYLRERGVDIDGSALFPAVHSLPLNYAPLASGHDLPNIERNEPPGFNWTSTNPTVLDTPPVSMDDGDTSPCVPEIGIIRSVSILGRAPGFRRRDVEAAFQSALLIQSAL
ncbi:hypothetical protein NUU61_002314 [Penicillium alfredii]|uniref:Uncharacterized protein n=1 Tax=Penicillium alfredii TaxID=1506179 RepID=A0A9W9FRF4_9EURO|nr:uncharacterized protein NUU61_002314 [Penicillium alfredii]KAJ5104967.1 hypothetical protein NUU61_002314 [Penicillium alfredii]